MESDIFLLFYVLCMLVLLLRESLSSIYKIDIQCTLDIVVTAIRIEWPLFLVQYTFVLLYSGRI